MASLARQRPPSPAVVAATTATNGGGRARQIDAVRAALSVPPTSVLREWRPLPVSVCLPPLPAVIAAAAATDGGGRARQIVAVRRRPRRPAAALAVPSTSLRPWRSDIPPPFPVGGRDTCGGIPTDERKGRKSLFLFTAQLLRKTNLAEIFSEARSGTIARKNKKRITAGTHCQFPI